MGLSGRRGEEYVGLVVDIVASVLLSGQEIRRFREVELAGLGAKNTPIGQ